MAAILPKILSLAKITRTFLTTSRLSAVPVQRYSIPVSSYGEKITHTGQVTLINVWFIYISYKSQLSVMLNVSIRYFSPHPIWVMRTHTSCNMIGWEFVLKNRSTQGLVTVTNEWPIRMSEGGTCRKVGGKRRYC